MSDPEPLDPDARAWLADRHQAVLVTLRADGTPQTSNVVTSFDGECFAVSVTDDRAKTRNLRRDDRAVLHVLGDDFWSYAAVTCEARLSPVSREPGDATGRALLALHDAVADAPHGDPEEFHAAMVTERRLLLTLVPRRVVGQGW